MQEIIELKYDGPTSDGRFGIDVYEAVEALDGFADFIVALGRAVYGEGPPFRLTITGITAGSLDIKLIYDCFGFIAPFVGHAPDLFTAISHAVALFKHLKGHLPIATQSAGDGSVQITNQDGQITVVNGSVYNVVINADLGKNVEQFLSRPLKKEADSVEIRVDSKIAANANKNNADSFVSLGKGQELGTYTAETYLTIQTVVLEGDGLWRFSDGRNKFRAAINDTAFLRRVSSGSERFGRGDLLKVKLKSVQERIKGELRTTHSVEQVLDHQPYDGKQSTML
jgi:hypothetical protein